MIQKLQTYKKLFSYFTYIVNLTFKKHPGLYLLAFASIFSIAVEFLSIYIISKPTTSNEISLFGLNLFIDTINIPLVFIALLLIRFMTLFGTESFSVYYAKELQSYFSAGALRKILHTNLKRIETKEIGHYHSFAGDEASNAAQVIVSFTNIMNNAILIIAYLTLVMITSMDLMLFILGIFIVIAILFKQIYKYTFALGESQADLRRKSNSAFIDSLNGLRVIKAFSIENYMADQYESLSYQYFTVNSKLVILSLLSKYLPLIAVLLLFSLYYYLILQHTNTANIGSVIASLFMLLRLLHAIGGFTSIVGKTIGELKGTIHLIDFLKEELPYTKTKSLTEKIHHITFNNVSFSYGSSLLFNNLNVCFEKGKSYAIIGQTGSGKSTLLDLIMDFNTPTSGEVLINNITTNDLDEKSLANKILYVGQESIIFNTSVRLNLEINSCYNETDIEKSLAISNLSETIKSLEGGLDYPLQYRGTNLSGGQKQRLNIARALLRDPDVLILDESVNALDEKTRHEVVKNIMLEYKDKILIFVTHDKDILAFVDEVIDLDAIKENNAQNDN